jgi:hypothetical protein
MRALLQPVLDRLVRGGPYGRELRAIDVDQLLAAARVLLEERPTTRVELRRMLAERWPECDADSLSFAAILLVPVGQAPPRGIWGSSGQASWVTLESYGSERSPCQRCRFGLSAVAARLLIAVVEPSPKDEVAVIVEDRLA